MITASNVGTHKFSVLHILGIGNQPIQMMDIEERMSFFQYESEAVESVVFRFLWESMEREQARVRREMPEIFGANYQFA